MMTVIITVTITVAVCHGLATDNIERFTVYIPHCYLIPHDLSPTSGYIINATGIEFIGLWIEKLLKVTFYVLFVFIFFALLNVCSASETNDSQTVHFTKKSGELGRRLAAASQTWLFFFDDPGYVCPGMLEVYFTAYQAFFWLLSQVYSTERDT